MDIFPPSILKTNRDYGLSCEVALDLPVQAGWDTREVIAAIGSVAANKAIAFEEDPDPEADTAEAPDPMTPGSVD